MNWSSLESVSQFSEIVEQSSDASLKAVAIFKHSTRCSISSMAKSRVERSWTFKEELPIYYLDLIKHRDVSNEIAKVLNVHHESPQLLIIKDGKCVYHASHTVIDISQVERVIGN